MSVGTELVRGPARLCPVPRGRPDYGRFGAARAGLAPTDVARTICDAIDREVNLLPATALLSRTSAGSAAIVT